MAAEVGDRGLNFIIKKGENFRLVNCMLVNHITISALLEYAAQF